MNGIPQPANTFDIPAFAGRWFHWRELSECFWPGAGKRAVQVNPVLSPIRHSTGIYLLAWSVEGPSRIAPSVPDVKYIGETSNFRSRMGAFAGSAGFRGGRTDGHSGGRRWPKGATDKLWVAFYEVGIDLPSHLGTGLRKWMEAVALEEYRLRHGRLPQVNAAKDEVTFS